MDKSILVNIEIANSYRLKSKIECELICNNKQYKMKKIFDLSKDLVQILMINILIKKVVLIKIHS